MKHTNISCFDAEIADDNNDVVQYQALHGISPVGNVFDAENFYPADGEMFSEAFGDRIRSAYEKYKSGSGDRRTKRQSRRTSRRDQRELRRTSSTATSPGIPNPETGQGGYDPSQGGYDPSQAPMGGGGAPQPTPPVTPPAPEATGWASFSKPVKIGIVVGASVVGIVLVYALVKTLKK